MSVKIKVLGTPFIEVDGKRLHLPLKKAEALVYYLAIEGTSNREKLACLLWGEKDEISAYNNFRNALYLLRRYFPADFIISDRRSVSLGSAATDIHDIESIENVLTPLTSGLCDELLKDFDVPESSEFCEWLVFARAQAKGRLIESLKARVTSCYDAEDEDNLQKSLEMLIVADPYDEDSILELMELYSRRRNHAKAASVFREYRNKLHDEMGLSPSERAENFLKKMLISSASPSDSDAFTDNPEVFFHGRKKEQELILDRIEKRPGKTIVVLVDGEPGVGKTSLVTRIVSLIKNDDFMFFSTMSYEAGLNYPYSSWNNLVAQAESYIHSDKVDTSGLNMPLLACVFPNFMSEKRLSYNADLVKVSEITPMVIGRSVGRLVAAVSGERRPVVVLEDVHWFDSQSLHTLDAFLATLPVPAVVFITTRPEKSDYMAGKLKRAEDMPNIDFLRIPLKSFNKNETQTLCRLFLDETSLSQFDGEYVYRESEGLPLLVVELIKNLRTNSKAELVKGGLGGVMLARFGEISESKREFLRMLSVFTNGAKVSTIKSVLGEQGHSAPSDAEYLLRTKMIQEDEETDGSVVVKFRHTKVRECVYNSIPAFRRMEYHKKAAEALSLNYFPHTWNPALSSMLCYHYTAAGLPSKVLNQHLREMIYHINLNHDLFPMIQDDILLSCKLPYSDRADTEKKMDEMKSLLAAINTSGEGNLQEVLRMEATYLELCGGYLVGWGEYKEGRVFINRALRMAKQYSFNDIHIHCLQHIGHHFLQTDNWKMLLDYSREMLHLARDDESEKYIGTALRFIGVAFQMKGDMERSEKVLKRSIEVFQDLALTGKRYTINMLAAHCYIGEIYHWQGLYDKAIEQFKYCTDICESKGLFWGCSHFHAHIADVAFDMDDMDMMFYHVYKGAELFKECRGGRCGSTLFSLKAIADAKQGRFDDAYDSLEAGELLSAPIRKKSWTSVHLMAKSYLAEIKEKGLLPKSFDVILTKSAREYAKEAAEIYRQIPIPHRYNELCKKFNL